ncbi:hypothetical protein [Streptomyces sp. 900105245]
MARTIRNNSVRLRFATIAAAAAAVTGGIVLPATTAIAAPMTGVPSASPVDPVDPPLGPFEADPPPVQPDPPLEIPDKAPPNPYEETAPVTWGYTPPEEPEQPSEPVDPSTILEKGLGD